MFVWVLVLRLHRVTYRKILIATKTENKKTDLVNVKKPDLPVSYLTPVFPAAFPAPSLIVKFPRPFIAECWVVYATFLNVIYDILVQIVHLRHVAAKPCSSFYFEEDVFDDDDGEGEDSHFSPIFLAPFMSRGHILYGVKEMAVGPCLILRTVLLLRLQFFLWLIR